MIDRSLASRAVRMQRTEPACLGKPPVRSDCPVALVLAVAVGQRELSSGAFKTIPGCHRTSSLVTGGRRC
jgi:hypothetical protein